MQWLQPLGGTGGYVSVGYFLLPARFCAFVCELAALFGRELGGGATRVSTFQDTHHGGSHATRPKAGSVGTLGTETRRKTGQKGKKATADKRG
jgi:hypothetical protein